MRMDESSVEAYLAGLTDDRRGAVAAVREVILEHLPDGFVESMTWGMPTYEVPLERYPDTYNGKPLMLAALASQKHHMAVYLTGVYADPESRSQFMEAYQATGKRMDIGRSCVRFKKLDDLPLDVVAEAIGAFSVDEFIELNERIRS